MAIYIIAEVGLFMIFSPWPQTTGKSKKDGEEAAGPPLVFVPNGKEQRIKDEEKMKVCMCVFVFVSVCVCVCVWYDQIRGSV